LEIDVGDEGRVVGFVSKMAGSAAARRAECGGRGPQLLDTMAEQAADPLSGSSSAAVARRILLDPAADLVDHQGAEPHHY
jgi:hypothetical protein